MVNYTQKLLFKLKLEEERLFSFSFFEKERKRDLTGKRKNI